MANMESDATYCSEAEKENLSQIRRSKRLSQKHRPSFRSSGDPAFDRFEEIWHMLKTDKYISGWIKHDWLALKFEVGLLKKTIAGRAVCSKITFVEKIINKHLRNSSVTRLEIGNVENVNVPREPVKSPNVLAGMTTEVLTELPPYQLLNSLNPMESEDQKSTSSTSLTQVNPLDLTKKDFNAPDDFCIQEESEICLNKCPKKKPATSIINLTDDNREVPIPIQSVAIEASPARPKDAVYTSKWLKYLQPSQKPNAVMEKRKPSSPIKTKPTSLKESLLKLYKDNPLSSTNMQSRTARVQETNRNLKVPSSRSLANKNSKDQPIRHTQSVVFERNMQRATLAPRNAQSERMPSLSSDCCFIEDFVSLELPMPSDDDSSSSLPYSLKESFKKVFGTDSLDDVLGCEKILYSLTNRHVGRLASAFNVSHDSMKSTIEQILTDDNCGLFEEDLHSGSSVVECSQSPPQRLFPSQKSQISK